MYQVEIMGIVFCALRHHIQYLPDLGHLNPDTYENSEVGALVKYIIGEITGYVHDYFIFHKFKTFLYQQRLEQTYTLAPPPLRSNTLYAPKH